MENSIRSFQSVCFNHTARIKMNGCHGYKIMTQNWNSTRMSPVSWIVGLVSCQGKQTKRQNTDFTNNVPSLCYWYCPIFLPNLTFDCVLMVFSAFCEIICHVRLYEYILRKRLTLWCPTVNRFNHSGCDFTVHAMGCYMTHVLFQEDKIFQ